MTNQAVRLGAPTHGSRGPERSRGPFRQAAAILQAEHHVTELTAYAMMVHAAAELGTSVREVAEDLIARAHGAP